MITTRYDEDERKTYGFTNYYVAEVDGAATVSQAFYAFVKTLIAAGYYEDSINALIKDAAVEINEAEIDGEDNFSFKDYLIDSIW